MFRQIVMRVSGLMERLFMGRCLSMDQQLLLNARPLHVKSTQESRKPAQQSAPRKRKPKSKVAQADITATSRKRTPKSAHQIPGQDGLQPVTPASRPASQSRKRKPLAAQPTTAEQSPKQTQKPAQTTSGKDGLQPAQLVPQIRLPVKPAVKAKAARVPSIRAALLSQQGQAPAQTHTEALSGDRGQLKTRASKTRQPASQQLTAKQKPAASTKAVKKRTSGQTPAAILTERKSKASGS